MLQIDDAAVEALKEIGALRITAEETDEGVELQIDEVTEPVEGTGMSIVRALVRDELGGTLALTDARGLRAEVRFPVER